MLTLNPKFVTDKTGNRISVILSIKEFKTIMEELEDLEDVRMYDEAKTYDEPFFPIDEAFKIIESERSKKNRLIFRLL